MKKGLVVLIVAVAGLLAYNYVTTGEIKLVPGPSMSESETRLAELQKEVERARSRVAQAGRTAGMSGLDSTADVSAARRVVDDVHRSLEKLKPTLVSDAEKKRARELENAIAEFRRDAG